jgi:thiol-disulfide isomerase/thioredoxin/uncharacterized membrane protein YphA (DoxX/SURF4 family)
MLDALILTSRLLLAAVFLVAAIGKLADRQGTRQAVAAFGVPEPAAAWLAPLLPLAELAVAVLLLPTSTALAGALGALGLLLLFSVAIAVNLARGNEPDCHCFGQLHSAPAGPRTLIRNAALAGVAALVVAGTLAGSDASAFAWVDGLDATIVAIAIAAGAILVLGAMGFVSLLRAYGRALVRLERVEQALVDAGIQPDGPADILEQGPELGTPAPAFTATDSTGAELSLDDLLAPGVPLVLLFASPQCGPCKELLPEVAGWQSEHGELLTVAVASDGESEQVRAEAEEFGLDRVIVDRGGELYAAFEAAGTPGAVVIAPDGSIASRVASGAAGVEALVADVIDAARTRVGAPVPPLELPSLDGKPLSLAELAGREALLVFWNPDCGFCQAMRSDLLAWEADANGEGPRLVVVSSGDAASTRREGFRSTVLLDEQFAAGEALGITGTPMAVLLDADGRIAADVATGAAAVLALARPHGQAEVLTLPAP